LDCWKKDEIDAFSNNIKVKLLLRCPVSPSRLRYSIKDNLEAIKLVVLDDWILELINRYIGSLKNKLIPYDHSLNIGVPVIQFGVDDFLWDGYEPFVLRFDTGNETLECSLSTKVINKDISLIYNEITDISDIDGGDLEVF
jgi:hypothetical protein